MIRSILRIVFLVSLTVVVAFAVSLYRSEQHLRAKRALIRARQDSAQQADSAQEMEEEASSQRTTAQTIALNASSTYIDAMLVASDSVVNRWPTKTARPIRVWIASTQGVPDALPDGDQLVKQAFFEWNLAGAPVRFEMSDSASADVIVGWIDRLPERRLGVTQMHGVNHFFVEGRILIATHRPDGGTLRELDVARCALHEIGHLLGLSHAADPSSIMYPELVEAMHNTRLTTKDLATARLWYALPVGKVGS